MELKNKDKRWLPLERTQFKIELPPNTLLLAERVKEQFNEVKIEYFSFYGITVKSFRGEIIVHDQQFI
jgi:hypothetical protein